MQLLISREHCVHRGNRNCCGHFGVFGAWSDPNSKWMWKPFNLDVATWFSFLFFSRNLFNVCFMSNYTLNFSVHNRSQTKIGSPTLLKNAMLGMKGGVN